MNKEGAIENLRNTVRGWHFFETARYMEKSHITVSQMEGTPNYLACGSTDTKPFYSSSILLRFRWQYLRGSMDAVNLGYSCGFPIAPPKSKSLGEDPHYCPRGSGWRHASLHAVRIRRHLHPIAKTSNIVKIHAIRPECFDCKPQITEKVARPKLGRVTWLWLYLPVVSGWCIRCWPRTQIHPQIVCGFFNFNILRWSCQGCILVECFGGQSPHHDCQNIEQIVEVPPWPRKIVNG